MSRNPARDEAYGPRIVDLVPHPDSPCPAIRRLQARACLLEAGLLSLGFTLTGDLDELVIPPVLPSVYRDRLWEHTCFEAFLARPGAEGYHELNVAPSTAWAAFAFRSYREDGKPAKELDPKIVVHPKPDRLELHALIRLDQAIPLKPGEGLRLGLSAVVEQKGGGLSYWAIRHPPGRPDFHHPDSFALEVTALPEEE